LAAAGGDGDVYWWDVARWEVVLQLATTEGAHFSGAFSPDGKLLASAGMDNTIRLWDLLVGKEIYAMTGHQGPVWSVAFSPDGKTLASASLDQTIRLWQTATGKEIRRLVGHQSGVTSVVFSPDGNTLVSGSGDNTGLIWDVTRWRSVGSPAGKLGAEGLAKAWADLAGADAARAFRARWALASAPEETLPLLKERLHQIPAPDAQRLRRLLADLDSKQFGVRNKAQAALEELGELAELALRETLANKPTVEVRRRVQVVLEGLRGPVRRPETLRSLRAVGVLESIATPPARQLLEELAAGAPGSRLTREAKASLSRLDRKTAVIR